MNADRWHSGPNPPTTDTILSTQCTTTYDDLLPASRHTPNDEVEIPALTIDFLGQELGVRRLNEIHDWLWLAGRPMPPRPLYRQKVLGREIIIHELIDFHLVWDERRVFLKPIPGYLLKQQFWQDILSCKEDCGSTCNSHNTKQEASGAQEKAHSSICERCEIHQYALGFMLSYASLISYENDFCMAKHANLLPSQLTWPEWRSHVKQMLDLGKQRKINKRYIFGELRLDRLNKIYRYSLRSPIRGYFYRYSSYFHFWHDNLVRIASVFAYLVIVLTAMQVGLATSRLQHSSAFQQASYGFTVFSILAPLALLGLFLGMFLVIFLFNLDATLRYWKKRRPAIERSLAANIA